MDSYCMVLYGVEFDLCVRILVVICYLVPHELDDTSIVHYPLSAPLSIITVSKILKSKPTRLAPCGTPCFLTFEYAWNVNSMNRSMCIEFSTPLFITYKRLVHYLYL